MALTDYVIMPGSDYQALCDKIREKTGKTGIIKSGDLVAEVEEVANSGSGSGGPILTKPIRFYDAYGNVLFSYSRAEIAKMTELPVGPDLGNLVFAGWDYTLDELKEVLYFCDVGPKYKNSTGQAVAVMIVEIASASTALTIYYQLNSTSYKMSVDWGDGTTGTAAGKDSSYYASNSTFMSHTYSDAGVYIISFYNSSTSISASLGTGPTNVTTYGLSTSFQNTFVNNGKGITPCKNIISLLGNNDAGVVADWCGVENCLQFVSGLEGSSTSAGRFLNCGSLKAIGKINKGLFNTIQRGNYVFSGCGSLKRARVTGTSTNMFDYCAALDEVEVFGSNGLAYPEINTRFSVLMTPTTPPTISATSPVWGTKPIYVPDEAVEAYKTADGWSNAADYIYPASQYPDN